MKIKKLLVVMFALVGLGLSSCQDEMSENNAQRENSPISFATYMSKPAVKSGTTGEMTLETLKNSGFGVFAYYTGQTTWDNAKTSTAPNFMYNQKVANDGSGWKYSPIKYWPNNDQDKVSFFAYAPHVTPSGSETSGITALSANTEKSSPKVTYVLSDDASKAVDFLYAEQTTNKTSDLTNDFNASATGKKVKFSFKHALSQIAFKVKSTIDGGTTGPEEVESANTKVFVESVEIKAKLHKGGIFDLAACTWDYTGYDVADLTLKTEATNLNDDINFTNASSKEGVKKDAVDLLKANNSFIIMPGTSTAFSVKIKYHVITKDTAVDGGQVDITNEITKTVNIKLDPSKKYSLTMNLGLKTVVFDEPTVENWGTSVENKDEGFPEISNS